MAGARRAVWSLWRCLSEWGDGAGVRRDEALEARGCWLGVLGREKGPWLLPCRSLGNSLLGLGGFRRVKKSSFPLTPSVSP